MTGLAMWFKQKLRPLIPDAVMARYRVRQHSRAVRTNVDIFATSDGEAKRWLRLTPDTYRVVTGLPSESGVERFDFVGAETGSLEDLLGFDEIDVAVAGETLRPSMRGLRVVEPQVIPTSILAKSEAFDEIGGVAENRADLVRTYQRLADTGRRIGLIPTMVDELPNVVRADITASAVVLLAAVPLHDIGGGSRAAQIAFELLVSGFHVTYVAMFPSVEGVDLGLRYVHPMLEQYRIETFDLDSIAERADAGVVILEAPAEPFVKPVRNLQERGWKVVYDIIDDWTDSSLGGDWYKADIESAIAGLADAVVASAPDLVRHGENLGSDAILVPNAVNSRLFGPIEPDAPADLPPGDIIGYAGSLYGEWFDWDALRDVADAFPDSTVVVIGDDRYKRPMPVNVMYLGLKAQSELPGYVQRFDVGLVPFVVSKVTHAVSPLKVYEYLASGVPVAAPPLRALEGLGGVHTDADLVSAVSMAKNAPRPDRDAALSDHSWHARVVQLLSSVDETLPEVPGTAVEIERRAPIHYSMSERRIHLE